MSVVPAVLCPFRSTQGKRTFDFNTDGMAHIGMYPDFFADLLKIGMTSTQLQPVFRSAEQYIALWQQVEHESHRDGSPSEGVHQR